MKANQILVPVDFSNVSASVTKLAHYLAKRQSQHVTLLHVEDSKSTGDPLGKMKELTSEYEDSTDVKFDFMIRHGNPLQEIAKASAEDQFGFMVIGSHGYKGIREKVFGTDILKLLKTTVIPVLVIQQDFMIPTDGFTSILLPVSTHQNFNQQVNATIFFARLFDATVYLYAVEKPGTDWPEEIRKNLKLAEDLLKKQHVSLEKVTETTSSFSVGFAKQILDYARRENMRMISMMANATREYYYIADSDKVNLLTNESGIPVLSVCDRIATE